MTMPVEQQEAKRIVGNVLARAYGFRRTDDFADACPTCHGDGEIPVGGYSVNPGSGVLVNDPQEAHPERCPECGGTGEKSCF